MKKISRPTSSRGSLFALFLLFPRFTNHRMPYPGLGMKAFGPSWCFSATLRWSSRCSQLVQKGGHGSSHLRQGKDRATCLPRSIAALHQRASQDQEIMRTGNHPRPAFGPLRRTQPWNIPEQFLLVEAIAMLVRIAQPIGWTDLGQRSRLLTFPEKPADLGVTRLSAGSMTNDLDERDADPTGGAQMQVVPTPHLNLRSFGVAAFPDGIWLAMAALIFALKPLPILAAGSLLSSNTGRGRAIEDAIAFHPQQATGLDIAHTGQKRHAGIPAVTQNDGTQPTRDQHRHHRSQLAGGDLGCHLAGSDPRRVQHVGALTSLLRQENHVAYDPPRADRMGILRQIGDGDQRPILCSFALRTVQVAGVHAQKDELPRMWQRREVHEDLSQPLRVNLTVLQGFVQTGPGSFKEWREGQFGKTACACFTGEGIHQIEQSVFAVSKTSVHLVTKSVQCVKVHESNAPEFASFGYITPPRNPLSRIVEVLLLN